MLLYYTIKVIKCGDDQKLWGTQPVLLEMNVSDLVIESGACFFTIPDNPDDTFQISAITVKVLKDFGEDVAVEVYANYDYIKIDIGWFCLEDGEMVFRFCS